MMYRALYRKWRPQTFSDVVGQSHITVTLCNELKAGKLAHAYLFTVESRGGNAYAFRLHLDEMGNVVLRTGCGTGIAHHLHGQAG